MLLNKSGIKERAVCPNLLSLKTLVKLVTAELYLGVARLCAIVPVWGRHHSFTYPTLWSPATSTLPSLPPLLGSGAPSTKAQIQPLQAIGCYWQLNGICLSRVQVNGITLLLNGEKGICLFTNKARLTVSAALHSLPWAYDSRPSDYHLNVSFLDKRWQMQHCWAPSFRWAP